MRCHVNLGSREAAAAEAGKSGVAIPPGKCYNSTMRNPLSASAVSRKRAINYGNRDGKGTPEESRRQGAGAHPRFSGRFVGAPHFAVFGTLEGK